MTAGRKEQSSAHFPRPLFPTKQKSEAAGGEATNSVTDGPQTKNQCNWRTGRGNPTPREGLKTVLDQKA